MFGKYSEGDFLLLSFTHHGYHRNVDGSFVQHTTLDHKYDKDSKTGIN